jgi:NADH dehydrogenase
MDKYVIVTGSNGYLGYYVCRKLLLEGYSVIGLKYHHFASRLIDNEHIRYFQYDLSKSYEQNPELLQYTGSKNIIAVINLAALLGSSIYANNYAVNAEGLKNIMEFARLIKVNRVIQISSVVVLKKIMGPYGITKLKGQEFLTSSELEYTVFIPAMILGPESLGLNRVLKNVFRLPFVVPIIGSGKQTQHPVFVEDFAEMIVKSMETIRTFRKTYEIAGDTVLSFKDFVRLILKIKKRKKVLISIPVFIAGWLGRFFQIAQKVPLFTSEHVKGVLQDSKLDTRDIKADLKFNPTPLEIALEYSLREIGNNWNYYLKTRTEETFKLQVDSHEKNDF